MFGKLAYGIWKKLLWKTVHANDESTLHKTIKPMQPDPKVFIINFTDAPGKHNPRVASRQHQFTD